MKDQVDALTECGGNRLRVLPFSQAACSLCPIRLL